MVHATAAYKEKTKEELDEFIKDWIELTISLSSDIYDTCLSIWEYQYNVSVLALVTYIKNT